MNEQASQSQQLRALWACAGLDSTGAEAPIAALLFGYVHGLVQAVRQHHLPAVEPAITFASQGEKDDDECQ